MFKTHLLKWSESNRGFWYPQTSLAGQGSSLPDLRVSPCEAEGSAHTRSSLPWRRLGLPRVFPGISFTWCKFWTMLFNVYLFTSRGGTCAVGCGFPAKPCCTPRISLLLPGVSGSLIALVDSTNNSGVKSLSSAAAEWCTEVSYFKGLITFTKYITLSTLVSYQVLSAQAELHFAK